jgi:hypothetical protein
VWNVQTLFIDFDGTPTDILRRQVETIHDTAINFGCMHEGVARGVKFKDWRLFSDENGWLNP